MHQKKTTTTSVDELRTESDPTLQNASHEWKIMQLLNLRMIAFNYKRDKKEDIPLNVLSDWQLLNNQSLKKKKKVWILLKQFWNTLIKKQQQQKNPLHIQKLPSKSNISYDAKLSSVGKNQKNLIQG